MKLALTTTCEKRMSSLPRSLMAMTRLLVWAAPARGRVPYVLYANTKVFIFNCKMEFVFFRNGLFMFINYRITVALWVSIHHCR